MQEIWKDILNYEGYYQISNYGNIKSFHNYRKGSILKPRLKKGYYQIGLRKEGKRKWYAIHRLVAQAFIPNPNNLPQVNHKDENKLNNNVNNLEWCSVCYNNCYGSRLKRVSYSNKLRKPVIKFDLNGNYIEKYLSITEAFRNSNVKSVSSISACCNGKTKKTKGYIYKFESEVVLCLLNMLIYFM